MHLFEALRDNRHSFDLIWIHCQRLDDPLWTISQFTSGGQAVASSCRRVASRETPLSCLLAHFRGIPDRSPDEVGLSGENNQAILAGHEGPLRGHAHYAALTQVASFLDEVNRVYGSTWQGRTYGGRIHNGQEEIARLEGIAAGLSALLLLAEEARAIAFMLGYQYHDHYFYEETGYDSARSSTSPGSVLTHAVIEDLFSANTPRELSFGFGDGPYKRTFGNVTYDVLPLCGLVWRWRLILGTQQLLNARTSLVGPWSYA